jgi:urea carboxylase-associated protein 2
MHIHRTSDQIAADRARYEAHQRRGLEFAPKALPDPSPRPAPAPEGVLGTEVIPFGWYSYLRLSAGQVLRLQMGGIGSSVSLACWSAADTSERLNLPDTVKVQWTTELRKGRVLFSDMGRVMLSITEDSSGAHDALTGGSPGGGTPGARNCRDNMLLAAAKLGLDRRDLPALMTFFAPVRVDAEGRFGWRSALLAGDDWLDLRAEMSLLVALSNTRHPLDPAQDQPSLTVTRLATRPVPADDLCRTASAEAVRGFENTARM